MQLYAINREIETILNQVDPETGEISTETCQALESLEIAKADKVLNIGKYLKSMDAEAKAIAEEIRTLTARKRAIENRYENIKTYLVMNTAGESYKDAQCVISWRKSESINIVCIEEISDEFFQIKKEVSKSLIKEAMKAGRVVTGAEIVINNNIQIK